MNALTHDTFVLRNHNSAATPFSFKVPDAQPSPKGRGQGHLFDLLGFIARKTEQYAFRWDDGEWMFANTDREMFFGTIDALKQFSISKAHVVAQGDTPLSFIVTSPDGSKRTLQFNWSTASEDMKSQMPYVKPYPGWIKILAVGSAPVLGWGLIGYAIYAFDIIPAIFG